MDDKKYFIASNEGPLGPYTVPQLCERGVDPDSTYVWCEGMSDWMPVAKVDELTRAMAAYETEKANRACPPQFDRGRFDTLHTPTARPKQLQNLSECPKNNLALAIIAIILFFPLGIPAVVYASNVYPRWLQGDREGAVKSSRRALWFSIAAIIIGAIFNYYSSQILESLALG